MSTIDNAKNTLKQKANQRPARQPKGIKDYIVSMEPAIKKALPSVMTPERFTRIMLTAVSTNPKLAECSPESFCGAMMQAAQLGLEPNTPLGQAYLIPYGKQCQFQLGYKGMLDLAYRSGEIENIQAHTVYENDVFDYGYGLDPYLVHKPVLKDKGEPIAFYAIYKTKSGSSNFCVMSLEDMQAHAKKYSQAYRNGRTSPWSTDFESMALKTVLKQVLKYAPLKTEFTRQIETDNTVKSISLDALNEDKDISVLDLPDETEYEVVPDTGEIIMPGVTDVQSE